VGHLPKELSRFMRFILHHEASASAKVIDSHHHWSPLVQGGLEIPILVTVTMASCKKNELAIKRFKELVAENYKEPVNDSFEDATSAILQRLKQLCDGEADDQDSDSDMDIEF